MTSSCSSTAMSDFWSSLDKAVVGRSSSVVGRPQQPEMKLDTRISILFAYMVLLSLGSSFCLFLYIHAHPGAPIPRFISVSMLLVFVFSIGFGSFALARTARKQASIETADQRARRRTRAIKGLRVGLVVWILIFLNDVRMLVQRDIQLIPAIVGMSVVAVLIVVSWTSLRRLKAAETLIHVDNRRSQP